MTYLVILVILTQNMHALHMASIYLDRSGPSMRTHFKSARGHLQHINVQLGPIKKQLYFYIKKRSFLPRERTCA